MSSIERRSFDEISNTRSGLAKRLFDILFSLFILTLFSPLLLAVIVIIKLSSKGPCLYTQERLGLNGKTFKCLKFRTMEVDADERLSELLENNPAFSAEWQKNQKLKNDPRVFAFGKFLRKTSLDEFPQFLNVLKGDLSVVGPRPYMVDQEKELGPLARQILSVRPGITGIWQTSGRNHKTFKERIELDCKYVETSSFGKDLKLVIKTMPILFLTKDAY
jgi:exopolysaccharide production protein ExoY